MAHLDPVELPRDERLHAHRVEWWHFVGRLRSAADAGGRGFTFGFLVLKESRHEHPLFVGLHFLVDHAGTAYPLHESSTPHAVYSEYGRHGFHFDFEDRRKRGTWSVHADDRQNYWLGASGAWTLELSLKSTPAHLLGSGGIMDYGDGRRLTYYVRTRIPTAGRLALPGAATFPVEGETWLERQWGDASVRTSSWRHLPVMLDDGERWVFFRVERRSPPHRFVYGARLVDGAVEPIPPAEIELEESRPVDGYRLDSRILVPSRRLDLRVRPWVDGQAWRPRTPFVPDFYEGGCRVVGESGGRPVTGWAMTEITTFGGAS